MNGGIMSLATLALCLSMTTAAGAHPTHRHTVTSSDSDLKRLDARIDAAFHGGTRRELRRLLFKSVDLDRRSSEIRTLAWALTMASSEDDVRMGQNAFVFTDAEFADLGGLADPVLAAIARAKAGAFAKARALYEWSLKEGREDPKRYEDYGDWLSLEEGWRRRTTGREAEAVPLLAEAARRYEQAVKLMHSDRTLSAMRARLNIKRGNNLLTLSRIDPERAAEHREAALWAYTAALVIAPPDPDLMVDMEGASWKATDVWGKAQEQARRHLRELGAEPRP